MVSRVPKLLALLILSFLIIYVLFTLRFLSRFDFCPQDALHAPAHNEVQPIFGRKLRMLFFTHGFNYEYGMDRHFFLHYYALKNHESIEVELWGIGIDNYNASITLKENLIGRYGSIYFDVIHLYGMVKNTEVRAISNQTIVLLREHECWAQRCTPVFMDNGARLAMLTYASEVLPFVELSKNALVMHSPHTSNHHILFGDVNSRREIDVLLIGQVHPLVYPLRTRFKKLIESGKIPGAQIRRHPGYFAKGWNESFWEHYELNVSNIAIAEQQVHAYAADIKNAKICFIDSSAYKYALQKYTEVPLSGCLAVGDVPNERMDEIREWIVEVNLNDSDEKIIETIKFWLSNDEMRKARAKKGQEFAMKYTVEKWGDTVIQAVNRIHTKGYGMVMNHQFEVSCTAEAIPLGKNTNAYCASSPNATKLQIV
jgi:hypothetical protein